MMHSWKRMKQFGPEGVGVIGRGGRRIGREVGESDRELSKMDTIIMQVSRVRRNVAEVNESCMCLEDLIAKEDKEQSELEAKLKTSSSFNPLRSQQHALTKTNLQASIQLIKDQSEREEREKRRFEEELDALVKRMNKIKESKLSELNRIKDHYGSRLVSRENIEQQKKILELKKEKEMITPKIMQLEWDRKTKQSAEWKEFVAALIKIARLKKEIRDECSTLHKEKTSLQLLQTAVQDLKEVNESSPNIPKNRVEDLNQSNEYTTSSSSLSKQPEFPSSTTNQGSTSTSTMPTYHPPLPAQGLGSPLPKSPFTTSLSFLKLPHVKFAGKKIENCVRNAQNYCGGGGGQDMPSNVPKECPGQVTGVASSNQDTTTVTSTPDPVSTSTTIPSHSSPFSNISQFSPVKSKRGPSDKASSMSPITTTTCIMKPSSLSPRGMTQGSPHSLGSSTPRPRSLSCSFIPQPLRNSSPSVTKTMTINPSRVCKGVSPYRFRSVKVPALQSKCMDGSLASRGLRSPPLKFRGVIGVGGTGGADQCLLSKYQSVPPSSRGPVETPPLQNKTFAVCPPTPYQKPFQNYSTPSLDISRFSLSTKVEMCKETPVEIHHSTNQPQDETNLSSGTDGVTSKDTVSGSCSNVHPSDQEKTPSSSASPSSSQPMEVDSNESCEVGEMSPSLPTSQEFQVTKDSVTNEVQMQETASPEVTQHTGTYNENMCSSSSSSSAAFIKFSTPEDTSHTAEHSTISTTTTTTPTTPMTSTPDKPHADTPPHTTSTPTTTPSLSYNPSHYAPTSQPSKDQFQFSSMKTLEYKKPPATPDLSNRFQTLNTATTSSPVQDSVFSSLFQGSLQTSTGGGSQPFNLFGSPVTDSPTQPSNEGSQGGAFFMFGSSPTNTEDHTNTNAGGLFNFNLGSDGESMSNTSSSGFLSSLFDSSSANNTGADSSPGFHLF